MSEKHIKIVEGDDPRLIFRVLSVEADGSRTKYDLTDATITFYLYEDRDSETALVTQSGSVSGEAVDGTISVQLSSGTIPAPGTYWYALKSESSGSVTTVAYGICTVMNV